MRRYRQLEMVSAAFVLMATLQQGSALGQQGPALTPGPDGVIFTIGVEDKSRTEFAYNSWKGIDAFECTVGIDCTTENFPLRLYALWAAKDWDNSAVARDVINFNLGNDVPNAVFRVARFGSETSVVRVDGGEEIVIARDMMGVGSVEDGWGWFELPLADLEAGPHQIVLSVLDDKNGSGRHSLDAITLRATE